jgi:hypothetical protein
MVTVAPILLSTTVSQPMGGDWALEPKWDVFRFLTHTPRRRPRHRAGGPAVGCHGAAQCER